jgi:hypothetical protein
MGKIEEAAHEWVRAIQLGIPNIQTFLGLWLTSESLLPSIVAEYIGQNIMDYLWVAPVMNEAQKCILVRGLVELTVYSKYN